MKMKPFSSLTDRGRVRRLRQLALHALKYYDLELTNLRLITNSQNGIFRVDTRSGEKWVFRISLPEGGHTLDHVIAEMDWLAALAHDTDISVPRPLPARNGSLVVEASSPGVPETRLCAVFSWVPGTNLSDHISPLSLVKLGELMARLHIHARNYTPPPGLDLLCFDRVFAFPEPILLFEEKYVITYTQEQLFIFQKAFNWAQQAIDHLEASGEPMRILHGDLHQWNVRQAHGVLSPIDFEDLMWGWPVQDIATTLYYFIDMQNYSEMRAAFKDGYTRHECWPERYSGEIEAFIVARGLGMANYVLNNPGCVPGFTPAEFLKRIERRLVRLMEY